jgi:hypothetical protein
MPIKVPVTGKARFKLYKYNPNRIVADGKDRFEKSMRKHAPSMHSEIIKKLWSNAQTSNLHVLEDAYVESRE